MFLKDSDMEKQTDGETGRWRNRQMEKQTDGETDRWRNRKNLNKILHNCV
jgi:hypothetical protein